LKIYIVIPAHNEEDCIALMLESLTKQTILPQKVVVVNDHSTDNTQDIINTFTNNHHWLQSIQIQTSNQHIPGSKVIHAFNKGFETLDANYDIICKFDADIILPNHYLESIIALFNTNDHVGMAGGLAYIKKNNVWMYEEIASKNHVRGPIKAYRKNCFKAIGGLKKSIGWDTVDVMLAQYYGWEIKTNKSLIVKHLKPTGNSYHKNSKHLQGEAFYKMRYGFKLMLIATLKKGFKHYSFTQVINDVKGFLKAKSNNVNFIVTEEEGRFIRLLRWKGIRKKLGL